MRLSGTLLLALLAASARADDAAAPPADSIADAKKDLAAIKSPVNQADTSAALPTLDMKDVGPLPGAAARPDLSMLVSQDKDATLDPTKKKTGTGNWLVDAMDKNTSNQASRSKEKDDILKGDPDLIRADEKGVRLEKDPLALDDTRDKEQRAKEPAEAVYNPLDAFMSGWVSARDRELLLTTSKGDGLTGADLGKAHADALPGTEAGQPSAGGDFAIQQVDPSTFDDAKGANPYVGALDVPLDLPMRSLAAPDASVFAPTELEDAARGMSTSGVDARPIDTSHSFIPDFAQPDDDDKYFKQMKKF
jgi:hypothetical protein